MSDEFLIQQVIQYMCMYLDSGHPVSFLREGSQDIVLEAGTGHADQDDFIFEEGWRPLTFNDI